MTLNYTDYLEKEWTTTQTNLSTRELLDIFPQSVDFFEKQIKDDKIIIDKLRTAEREVQNILYEYTSEHTKWFWEMVAAELYTTKPKMKIEKRLKRNVFLTAMMKQPTKVSKKSSITEQDILEAKEVPLDTLLEVNRSGFAICVLHKERTASLKVYSKTNTWYCFGCNAGIDSIDLVQKIKDLTFIEAVKLLIKK